MERIHPKRFENNLPNYQVSKLGEKKYVYISGYLWEKSPLPVYNDLSSANLLSYANSYQRTYDHFKNSDFIVDDQRFPKILVTQHHHRLLFECQKGLIPKSKRTIINIDEHDDFYMNDGHQGVDIGNWGAIGIELDYWQHFVHLSPSPVYYYQTYLKSENDKYVLLPNKSNGVKYSFSQFLEHDWKNNNDLDNFHNNGKYILSIDADAVALNVGHYDEPINNNVLRTISNFVSKAKDDPNLELIHFSLSPTHCNNKSGEYVWNYLKRELLKK